MFDLQSHGPDTYVGAGPRYPWGGLYGGQVVAQSLRAASLTVDNTFAPHSIRAYFIRPGDHAEPVRYEVDRIRNGRSFVTRRVVARQAIGAILNAECSFQREEEFESLHPITAPPVAGPDASANSSFTHHFERRWVSGGSLPLSPGEGAGRVAAWMRVVEPIDDDPIMHQAWLAFISDDLPSDAVKAALRGRTSSESSEMRSISLDHTIWFHRPMRADRWHLHDFRCHHVSGARGLALGHVFDESGIHVATVAQEVLLRQRAAGAAAE